MISSLQDHQHQQVIMCPVLNWICEWNNRTGSAAAYSIASRTLRIRCQPGRTCPCERWPIFRATPTGSGNSTNMIRRDDSAHTQYWRGRLRPVGSSPGKIWTEVLARVDECGNQLAWAATVIGTLLFFYAVVYAFPNCPPRRPGAGARSRRAGRSRFLRKARNAVRDPRAHGVRRRPDGHQGERASAHLDELGIFLMRDYDWKQCASLTEIRASFRTDLDRSW